MMTRVRYLFPSGYLSKGVSVPSHSVLRNDVLKPSSLGFMKEISEEEVTKQTELSTLIDDNLKILETVLLPKDMQFKDASEVLKKIIKKDIEKDPLHDVAVKLSKYAKDFYRKMELYFEGVFNYHEKLKESLKMDLFDMSKEYVMSDLPPSYIETLALSFLTECKYLDVFDFQTRRERLGLIGVRNNRTKFKRICDKHNRWVDFLHSSFDPMIDSRVRLVWYVDLNNCRTVKEAFKIKELRKSNLDEEQFFGLLLDAQQKTEQIRKSLIEMSRNIFQIAQDRKDPTVDLLCNVMEFMNR